MLEGEEGLGSVPPVQCRGMEAKAAKHAEARVLMYSVVMGRHDLCCGK